MTKELIPKHIGLIMDGNRRWAKAQGLSRRKGYVEGQETLRAISKYAFQQGVSAVSVFAFSTENWQRAQEEVNYLMKLVHRAIDNGRYLNELHEGGIKVVFLGERKQLDKKIIVAIEKAEKKTAQNTKGTLAICFNYGGHAEIADAVKEIVSAGVSADDVTPELIARHLYAPDVPPIDLIIRTSGEQRLSGFMLWRAEYSELYFSDKHWPEFTPEDLDAALTEYARRKRRFGK